MKKPIVSSAVLAALCVLAPAGVDGNDNNQGNVFHKSRCQFGPC